MLQNTRLMIDRLEDLKQLGVQLAIDDFGHGLFVTQLPVAVPFDILKIDKVFYRRGVQRR